MVRHVDIFGLFVDDRVRRQFRADRIRHIVGGHHFDSRHHDINQHAGTDVLVGHKFERRVVGQLSNGEYLKT